MNDLMHKLGTVKTIDLTRDFNMIVDKYRKIADATGYKGELKFKKEGGFTVIFIEIKKLKCDD